MTLSKSCRVTLDQGLVNIRALTSSSNRSSEQATARTVLSSDSIDEAAEDQEPFGWRCRSGRGALPSVLFEYRPYLRIVTELRNHRAWL